MAWLAVKVHGLFAVKKGKSRTGRLSPCGRKHEGKSKKPGMRAKKAQRRAEELAVLLRQGRYMGLTLSARSLKSASMQAALWGGRCLRRLVMSEYWRSTFSPGRG